MKLSILLFDEIEKASDALWQLLLGILDKATLTLGDNSHVDLSRCIIIMTSNLGASEMANLVHGRLGFLQKADVLDDGFDEKIDRIAVEAARRKFTPEFINRIDKVVVFKTLRLEHLQQILDIELGFVQQRVLRAPGTNKFVFNCTESVKDFLLEQGTDPKYGARHLKRAIERNVVFPLANLVATAQLKTRRFRANRSQPGWPDDFHERGGGSHGPKLSRTLREGSGSNSLGIFTLLKSNGSLTRLWRGRSDLTVSTT